jgi:hypothetical protein
VQISLWDQNDGSSGTDAPETYEKALELPASDPGLHIFNECFLSGTSDIYDIYKISLKPNHSLTLKTVPVQWYGGDKRGMVRWDFLNRSFKRMKEGQSSLSETSPFMVRVFHPKVRSGNKPAIFISWSRSRERSVWSIPPGGDQGRAMRKERLLFKKFGRVFPPGALLFEEGQDCSGMYIIQKGRVRLYKRAGKQEVTIDILKEGDFFGEMACLLGQPRSINAVVEEESQILIVEPEVLEELFREKSGLGLKVLEIWLPA